MQASGSLTPAYWAFWSLLMITVAAEFSVAVWGPSYLETVLGLSRSTAVLAVAAFPMGMVAGRFGGVAMLHRFRPQVLVVPSIALAFAGFMLFWQGGSAWAGLAGLFVTGLGLANLYPLGITLAVAAAGSATSAATAADLARVRPCHHHRSVGARRHGRPLRHHAGLYAGASAARRRRGRLRGGPGDAAADRDGLALRRSLLVRGCTTAVIRRAA